MMLERVAADKLQLDVFSVFGTNNGLLMAGDTDDARVMTVGWANLGRTWNILRASSMSGLNAIRMSIWKHMSIFPCLSFP